ncbi:zinc finger MYM-type protein 1-like [Papaver somniferum]|uniref:zinc finger MYM-type protein 1-like n=1 Tax=Papaver somniferum TaxID=3469 RepID=UPI000E6F5A71|nr:zinc finger MYM-type protein 1-like [Papaver somniferum]
MENFEFLLSMVIWHNVLFVVNVVRKTLQGKDIDINDVVQKLKGLISFLESYRDNGFEKDLDESRVIATQMGIEPEFRIKRFIYKKTPFGEPKNVEVRQSPEESFRANFFIYIMDQALFSVRTRFEQFQIYEEKFGFLFDMQKLTLMDDRKLLSLCTELESYLKDGTSSDIDGAYLFSELMVMSCMLPNEVRKPIEVLEDLKNMVGLFPNAWVAYRILLTIPVTVATAERVFSKFKLIKNYLRSSMSQERLNGLAMLSIEHVMSANIDYGSLIHDFACENVRRESIFE